MALHSPIVISSPSNREVFFCSSSPNIPPLDALLRGKKSPPCRAKESRVASIPGGAAKGFQSARILLHDTFGDDVRDDIAQDIAKPRKRRRDSSSGREATVTNQEQSAPQNTPSRRSPRLGRYVFEGGEAIEDGEDRRCGGGGEGFESKNIAQEVAQSKLGVSEQPRTHSQDTLTDSGQASNGRFETTTANKALSRSYNKTAAPRHEVCCEKSDVLSEKPLTDATHGEDQHCKSVLPAPCNEPSLSTNHKLAENACDLENQGTTIAPKTRTPPPLDFHAAWSYADPAATARNMGTQNVGPTTSTDRSGTVNKDKATTKARKTKAKGPLKSSRTVTSIAIARYQETSEVEKQSEDGTIFGRSGSMQARRLLDPTSMARTKSKARPKSEQMRKKLSSPESAQLRVERQAFLFGSSSQLTKDEPAEHIVDLQRAIKASEHDSHDETMYESANGWERLWMAGARGDNLPLLQAEHIPRKVKTFSPTENFSHAEDCSDEDSTRKLATISTISSRNALHSISLNVPSPTKTSPSKIDCKAYSTEAAVAKASGKRPRGRPKKDATATSEAPESLEKKSVSRRKRKDEKPNVPPAKPRKSTKANKAAAEAGAQIANNQQDMPTIDDICVSDDGHVGAKQDSKPKFGGKKEREEFVANKAAAVFPVITDTVKGQPVDSDDPQRLTWHEKMLLYDPIVLEDFTLWLRSTLELSERNVMPVAELKPWMVQLWCEEHSVCCLWKEGLRGGVKLKY